MSGPFFRSRPAKSYSDQDRSAAIEKHIPQLRAYLNECGTESLAYTEIMPILNDLEHSIRAPPAAIQLKVAFPEGSAIVLANLPPQTSLQALKKIIEDSAEIPIVMSSMYIDALRTEVNDFKESITLQDIGLTDKSQIRVNTNTGQKQSDVTPTESTVDESVATQAVVDAPELLLLRQLESVRSPTELTLLSAHCILLGMQFVCLVEGKGGVPGFAPPLKDLPFGKLLPDDWLSKDPRKASFLYKHKDGAAAGRKYSLQATTVAADLVMLSLIETGGKSAGPTRGASNGAQTHSIEIIPSDYFAVDDSCSSSSQSPLAMVRDGKGLKGQLTTLLRKFAALERVVSADDPSESQGASAPTSSSSVAGSGSGSAQPSLGRPSPAPTASPHAPYAPPYRAEPPGIGSSDRDPFPPIGLPTPFSPFAPGSGSVVGPDHPLFGGAPGPGGFPVPGGGDFGYDPGFPTGPGLPRPRFDPVGPVPHPHGPHVGVPYPARGRGRGRGRAAPFGEPNPDHFRPPDDGYI